MGMTSYLPWNLIKRVQQLEAELAALKQNSVLQLNGFLQLETNDDCKTVKVSNANLQVVNGLGATDSTNGCGNLILGYNESRVGSTHGSPDNVSDDQRSGSHNLVIGPRHNYTSFAGTVAGDQNSISGEYASISAGWLNVASGKHSSLAGGVSNVASGFASSISGGEQNEASGPLSSVSAGRMNKASGEISSVNGGASNQAETGASVLGGENNTASGNFSCISGGSDGRASGLKASVNGGFENNAAANLSSILGGEAERTTTDLETIPAAS
ncbi:MAG: hypothetical protein OEY38_22785 [Gammaproteobacteria bacterium]|nr:hypothetical protein [Gammaproteobacteria bacterium]